MKLIIEIPKDAKLEDTELRKIVEKEWSRISTKIETINERTKKQTMEIADLKKRLKKLEAKS